MIFCEALNEYIKEIGCTARALGKEAGLSPATLSRYRSGERVPESDTEAFEKICKAIEVMAANAEMTITAQDAREYFLTCDDVLDVNREQLRKNFNHLLSALNVNISKLCRYTSYDNSTIFRFRNGTRQPADPMGFAAAVAGYIADEMGTSEDIRRIGDLLKCDPVELVEVPVRFSRLMDWLLASESHDEEDAETESLRKFLDKLDEFDLNEYIEAIKFNDMKVPSGSLFSRAKSKTYTGLAEMMESELEFLKETVSSKAMDPVIMYSDMPISKMAQDPDFPKMWMSGLTLLMKKGMQLVQIHDLDRSFEEMMIGLETWIPMYMTGQISPYYMKNPQNDVFMHLLKVSGSVALTGEAIEGHHEEGRYFLTNVAKDVEYYRMRAEAMLDHAAPLMDIYREERVEELKAKMSEDAQVEGKRKNVLSAPPIYTMESDYLRELLSNHGVPAKTAGKIIVFAEEARGRIENILGHSIMEDEIYVMTQKEFEAAPVCMTLSGCFLEEDINYTWDEYQEHLEQTRKFAKEHDQYTLTETEEKKFKNLDILIHEGKWAMVSKSKAPAIHFMIHHPKLRSAIEKMEMMIRD